MFNIYFPRFLDIQKPTNFKNHYLICLLIATFLWKTSLSVPHTDSLYNHNLPIFTNRSINDSANIKKLKWNFHNWLTRKHFILSEERLQSCLNFLLSLVTQGCNTQSYDSFELFSQRDEKGEGKKNQTLRTNRYKLNPLKPNEK